MNYDLSYIKNSVISSIDHLIENDGLLIKLDAHERTISNKLGNNLQEFFADLNVDTEYNRRCDGNKKEIKINNETSRVFPDIIIHSRNNNQNILAVEIKKNNNQNTTLDNLKLREFTLIHDKPNKFHYNYEYGLQLILNDCSVENPSNLKWYKNGEIFDEEQHAFKKF